MQLCCISIKWSKK